MDETVIYLNTVDTFQLYMYSVHVLHRGEILNVKYSTFFFEKYGLQVSL